MRDEEAFRRLQRPAGERDRAAEAVTAPLPSGWICLRDCNLSGNLSRPVTIPFVLLHPEVGVALLDIGTTPATDPEAVLRQRLEAARFESIFPGYLPIVHLRLRPAEIEAIDTILSEAFAALPALSVPGGDAWVSVLRRALTPRDPSRGAAFAPAPREPGAWRAPPPGEAAPPVERGAWQGTPPEPTAGLPADRPTPPRMLQRHVPQPDSAPTEMPAPAAEAPARRRPVALAAAGLVAVALLAGAAVLLLPRTPDTAAGPEMATPAATSPSPAEPMPLAAAPSPPPPITPPAFEPVPLPRQAPPPPPVAVAEPPAPGLPLPPPPMPAPESPPPAAAGAPAAAEEGPRVMVRTPANFRAAPNTGSTVIRTAQRGETFRVFGQAPGGWVQVGEAEEPQGWIHSSLLEEVAP